MSGETELKSILQGLSPQLLNETYAFCTLPNGSYGDCTAAAPIASFQEQEGLTLVVPQDRADATGLEYTGLFRCITLQVQSSLESVGLTAVVAGKLAVYDISVNMIAGYYHDHLFVPVAQAEQALELINSLSNL